MAYDFNDCSSLITNKRIKANENGKELIIENPSNRKVIKVKVDGCLTTITGMRCDYLFEINQPPIRVIYLELKGHDIAKAYQQITATVKHFKPIHGNFQRDCHIIASRVPKSGPEIQQLKIKSLKENQAKLFVNTRVATILI